MAMLIMVQVTVCVVSSFGVFAEDEPEPESVDQLAHVVRFFDGVNPEPLELRYVLDGGTTTEREHPDLPPGMTAFCGWYTGPQSIDPDPLDAVTWPQTITGDTDFYPGWSDKFLVKFLDYNGMIIGTQQVAPGGTATKPTYQVTFPAGTIGTGEWLLDGVQYNFATPVTDNILLTPEVTGAFIVQFITKGTLVAPQIVALGGFAEEPLDPEAPDPKPLLIPIRTGYTFSHWSATDKGTTPFDFTGTPIIKNTPIYAVWTPQLVEYRIVYWLENVNMANDAMVTPAQKDNPENYSVAHTTKQSAFAGSTVEVTGTSWSKTTPGADPTNFTTTVQTTTGGVPSSAGFTVALDVNDPLPFSTMWKSDAKEVLGNGNTVINVYLVRDIIPFRVRITFPASAYNNGNYRLVLTDCQGTVLGDFLGGAQPYYVTGSFKLGQSLTTTPGLFPANNNYGANIEYIYVADASTGQKIDVTPTYYFDSFRNDNVNGYLSWVQDFGTGANIMRFFDAGAVQLRDLWFGANAAKIFTWTNYYEVFPGFEPSAGEIETPVYLADETPPEYISYGGKTYKLGTIVSSPRAGTAYFCVSTTLAYTPAIKTLANGSTYYPARWSKSGGALTAVNITDNQYMFYRLYNRNLYPLTLDLQGGEFKPADASAVASQGFAKRIDGSWLDDSVMYDFPLGSFNLPEPVKEGSVFLGWTDDPDGFHSIDFAELAMPAAPLVVYAQWFTCDHVVDFLVKGKVIASEEIEHYGTAIPIEDYETLTHYGSLGTFLGWSLETNGVLVTFDFETLVQSDLTLHAIFSPDGLTLTYDVDGGAGLIPLPSDGGNSYYQGAEARAAQGAGLTRDSGNELFAGWRLEWEDSEYPGELVYPGRIFTVMADGLLTARYVPKVLAATLTYHQNRSTADTATVDENYLRNETMILPAENDIAPAFSNPGYSFLGWSKSKFAKIPDVGLSAGDHFIVSEDTDLYAVWRVTQFTITYVGNGGKTATDLITYSETVTFSPSLTLKANEFERPGYTFEGWAATPSATDAEYADQSPVPYWLGEQDEVAPDNIIFDPLTFYAVWKESPAPSVAYTLTVMANTGGTVSGTPSGTYAESTDISVTPVPNSGYRFSGWTVTGTTIPGGNNANPAAFKMPANNVVLTANFEKVGGGSDGPKTGDGFRSALMVSIMAVGAVGIVATYRRKKAHAKAT